MEKTFKFDVNREYGIEKLTDSNSNPHQERIESFKHFGTLVLELNEPGNKNKTPCS